jgi:hypothetical protein
MKSQGPPHNSITNNIRALALKGREHLEHDTRHGMSQGPSKARHHAQRDGYVLEEISGAMSLTAIAPESQK